jgi:hypothetical protein
MVEVLGFTAGFATGLASGLAAGFLISGFLVSQQVSRVLERRVSLSVPARSLGLARWVRLVLVRSRVLPDALGPDRPLGLKVRSVQELVLPLELQPGLGSWVRRVRLGWLGPSVRSARSVREFRVVRRKRYSGLERITGRQSGESQEDEMKARGGSSGQNWAQILE